MPTACLQDKTVQYVLLCMCSVQLVCEQYNTATLHVAASTLSHAHVCVSHYNADLTELRSAAFIVDYYCKLLLRQQESNSNTGACRQQNHYNNNSSAESDSPLLLKEQFLLSDSSVLLIALQHVLSVCSHVAADQAQRHFLSNH
jgi:hypothetical protein